MSDISTWSSTDDSNNSTPPNGFPEGMAPATVNNAARAVMGSVRRQWERNNPYLASTGSANAYVLTYSAPPASYVTGESFSFFANFANTGAATLNINGLGATSIVLPSGAALTGAEISSGSLIRVGYNGSSFVLAGTSVSVASITSGTINNAVIGGTTPLAITGTTITGNSFIPNLSTVPSNGLFLPAANSVGLASNTTERLRLDSSGHLLVGYTADQGGGQALQVNGAVLAGAVSMSGALTIGGVTVSNSSGLIQTAALGSGSATSSTLLAGNNTWITPTVFAGGSITSTLAFSGAATNEARTTIASATTCNIGAAAANYLQVTGTATITAFDTVQAGAQRTLEFAGALTLTNSASILLEGGANITTAAGTSMVFRSEGAGVWRQVTPTLRTSGVTAGTYAYASATVDASGKITAISANTTAFTAKATSSQLTPPGLSSTLVWAHTLGAAPSGYSVVLHCVTGEFSWVTGDELFISDGVNPANGYGFRLQRDATNLTMNTGNGGTTPFMVPTKGGGTLNYITLANWKIIFTAWL